MMLDDFIESNNKQTLELSIATGEVVICGIERDLLLSAYARKYMTLVEAERVIEDFFCNYEYEDKEY